MKNIQAIFWDCDGTLVDSEKQFFAACRKVFKKYNVEITDQFISEENFTKNITVFELLRRAGYPEETILEAKKERNDVYAEILNESVEAIAGIDEILTLLHGKIPMAVVSNSYHRHLDIILKKSRLAHYFDFVVASEDVEHVKPNPEPYIQAVTKVGIKPENGLAIEDNIRGVIAAKGAGLTCFLVPNEMTRKQDYHYADRVFGNAYELLDYFKAISNSS